MAYLGGGEGQKSPPFEIFWGEGMVLPLLMGCLGRKFWGESFDGNLPFAFVQIQMPLFLCSPATYTIYPLNAVKEIKT